MKMMYSTVRFEGILDWTTKRIKELSVSKGIEYSGVEDRLANFRRYATALDVDYRQILAIYAGKHWDAILSYCKHGKVFSNEPIEGRIDDLILYMLLLKCMVDECRVSEVVSQSLANKEVISNG